MQHDAVGDLAGELQRPITDGRQQHRDVLVEARILLQVRERARGPVVVEHGLTPPQPAVEVHDVAQLRAGDLGQAHHLEQRAEPASETERVATAGEAVRGGGHRGGDQRVPGVVVGRGGADPDRVRGRGDRAGEDSGVFGVERLGQQHRPDAQPFGEADFVEDVARGSAVPGQAVAGELGELLTAHLPPSADVADH